MIQVFITIFSLFLSKVVFSITPSWEHLPPAEHENMGCPENSLCSLEMGQYRQEWLNLINELKKRRSSQNFKELEKFRQRNGLLVNFWSIPHYKESFRPILWESPCPHHRLKKASEKIYLGEGFIRDTKQVSAHTFWGKKYWNFSLGGVITLDPLILWDSSEHPLRATTYYVPQKELPLFIESGHLQLILETDNYYYGLKVSQRGDWQVTALPNKSYPLKEVSCPQITQDFLKKHLKLDYVSVYQSTLCYEIWDKSEQKKRLLQSFWACAY